MAKKRVISRRRQRQRPGDRVLLQALIPVGLLLVVIVAAFILLRPIAPMHEAVPTVPPCPEVAPIIVNDIRVPAGPIAGFCQSQLVNAVQIMRAADAYTPNIRAKQIGVMTAIGESGLRNLTYGDTAGPDSRGLFQQRSNWGTLAQRMDPYTAAVNFYHRMFGIVGWNTLPPTQVAHTVQGNADPDYYAKYFSRASRVVDALLADQVPTPPTAVPVS
jgi:hypothetical protein